MTCPLNNVIFHWLEGIGTMIIFVNTQLVLQYRIWAIYNRSTKMLVINGVLFLFEIAGSAALLAVYYSSQKLADVPLPSAAMSGNTCDTVPQREMALVFCTVLIYELWLVALALVRTMQVRRLVLVSGHRSLTEVVAYDSLIYFALIVASLVVVIILWIFTPVFPGNAAIAFPRAACGVGASRLLLHIKSEARERAEHTFSSPERVCVSLAASSGDGAGGPLPMRFARARSGLLTLPV